MAVMVSSFLRVIPGETDGRIEEKRRSDHWSWSSVGGLLRELHPSRSISGPPISLNSPSSQRKVGRPLAIQDGVGRVRGLRERPRKARRTRQLASPGIPSGSVGLRRACSEDPQPRAERIPSAPRVWALGGRSGPGPPRLRGRPSPAQCPALPGSGQRGAPGGGRGPGEGRERGDCGRTRRAGRRAPPPSPEARARVAVTSRATRQPRAPPGRARVAAEHMGPRAERARGGRDEEGRRGAASKDVPRDPPHLPVDFLAERMLADPVTCGDTARSALHILIIFEPKEEGEWRPDLLARRRLKRCPSRWLCLSASCMELRSSIF
ncbi:PREDICTED: collagen alpha-1(XI) chain-like [Cercocebus atys]|uniref:collagen alpha-1(XI) chain-like n=1 Tax=Cercocebus atys TaxID=9531 RepID=UPI0005F3B81D|nr:PREDICTED: collagen alpha-1(XI) chain-like [Cercocebus atys]